MSDIADIIDVDVLPYQMQQLIRCIGIEQTLALLKHRGGTPTYIPKNGASEALAGVLSRDSLALLSQSSFAGKNIELPKDDKYHQQLRNYAIRQTRGQLSGTEAALRFGLSRRMITNIRREEETDQLSLFD